MGSRFVEFERHLLLVIRVIGKRLAGYDQRRARDNLPEIEVVLDLVDLHVLEDEREVVIRVNLSLGNIPQVWLEMCARKESNTNRRSDEAELLRILSLAGLKDEPACA